MREGKEPMVTEELVLNALRRVEDLELPRDLVSLGTPLFFAGFILSGTQNATGTE
jgi:hypothetical protein